MSNRVKIKDVAVDKTISATVRTTRATKAATKASFNHTGRSLTNYSPDFYDKLEDVSTETAKELTADSIYLTRAATRGIYDLNSLNKKRRVRKKFRKNFIEKKEEEDRRKEAIDRNHDGKITSDEALDDITEEGHDKQKHDENKEKRKQYKKEAKKDWKNKSHDDKKQYYKNHGVQSRRTRPLKSTKGMFFNQSRKGISKLKQQDDMGAKSVGTVTRGAYLSIRYGKTTVRIITKIVRLFKHAALSSVHFVLSLPSLLLGAGGGIFLIIMTILMLLIVMFFSYSFEGRVSQFVDHEVSLEYSYSANVAPDEVLSITNALGWIDQDKEDYEALFALLMDGKDDDWNISYEKMLNNIFHKYNPAIYQWHGNIVYKHEVQDGEYVDKSLTYTEYLNLFPDYQSMDDDKKVSYGNAESITKLKRKAYETLEISGIQYTNRFILSETAYFKNPLKLEDIRSGASTFHLGYRSMMDGAFHAGTDIAASEGTKLYAVSDAKVIAVYNTASASGDICMDKHKRNVALCGTNFGGNQVILQKKIKDARNDQTAFLYIAYFHMKKGSLKVNVGDEIDAGTEIGEVGATGMAAGAHLHLQAWIDTEDGYHLPTSSERNDFNTWKKMIDATMLCDIEFRNHIYGR